MPDYRRYAGPPYPVENYHRWCCEWEPRCDQSPPGTGTTATYALDAGRQGLFCEKHAKMAWERDKKKPVFQSRESSHA